MTLVGLLGDGIATSLTPPMHRREAAALGLDYEYRVLDIAEMPRPVDDLPTIFRRVVDDGFDALNVTHPFKQSIIPLLDELDPDAERLGAVNLVRFTADGAVGGNTDWSGFRAAVGQGLGDVAGQRVLQVGAGGAGAATAYALLTLGVSRLDVVDQDERRARALAERYRASFPAQELEPAGPDALPGLLGAADGVVHATPTGMHHHPGIPFDVDLLQDGAWVSDVVYLPLETELVRRALAGGRRVLDGGRMAVGQAVDSLRRITGREPDPERMRAHFLELTLAEEVRG